MLGDPLADFMRKALLHHRPEVWRTRPHDICAGNLPLEGAAVHRAVQPVHKYIFDLVVNDGAHLHGILRNDCLIHNAVELYYVFPVWAVLDLVHLCQFTLFVLFLVEDGTIRFIKELVELGLFLGRSSISDGVGDLREYLLPANYALDIVN